MSIYGKPIIIAGGGEEAIYAELLASDWGTPVYSITATVTNGTATGDAQIQAGGTATVTIAASSGYSLPSTVTVSGATSSYDSSTGVITLSNPTGAVTISATCASGGYTVILTNSSSECPSLTDANGAGVEYSTDGGTTWTHLGDGAFDTSTTITLSNISSLLIGYCEDAWITQEMYGWDGSSWQTIDELVTGTGPADFTSLLGTYTKFAVRIDS